MPQHSSGETAPPRPSPSTGRHRADGRAGFTWEGLFVPFRYLMEGRRYHGISAVTYSWLHTIEAPESHSTRVSVVLDSPTTNFEPLVP